MGAVRYLLLLSVSFALGHSLEAPDDCGNTMLADIDPVDLPFSQVNRTGNVQRFCLARAEEIRAEHFWCRGYIDEDGDVVPDTERFPFPTSSNGFWTLFLQYPALSWMDINRKASIVRIIRQIAASQSNCGTSVSNYGEICVSNVELYDVAEYSESVLIVFYNLGVTGDIFDECFRAGLENSNSDEITRFRGRPALSLSLNVNLTDMFSQNIGPASSIGRADRDPTLRPIILGSWPMNISLSEARRRTSSRRYGSNPNPINYGLEAGDIVFAVLGSILLLIVGILVVLGFFIHPFFLS